MSGHRPDRSESARPKATQRRPRGGRQELEHLRIVSIVGRQRPHVARMRCDYAAAIYDQSDGANPLAAVSCLNNDRAIRLAHQWFHQDVASPSAHNQVNVFDSLSQLYVRIDAERRQDDDDVGQLPDLSHVSLCGCCGISQYEGAAIICHCGGVPVRPR